MNIYFIFLELELTTAIWGVFNSLKVISMTLLDSGVDGELHSPASGSPNISAMSKRFVEYVASSFPENSGLVSKREYMHNILYNFIFINSTIFRSIVLFPNSG
jgi:hypothetical protein